MKNNLRDKPKLDGVAPLITDPPTTSLTTLFKEKEGKKKTKI